MRPARLLIREVHIRRFIISVATLALLLTCCSTERFSGSGFTETSLDNKQVERIAVLGLVWGFLKYHHPRVAAGELNRDHEFFRVLPNALGAVDRDDFNQTLTQWVDELGVPNSCDPCADPPEDTHLLPRLDWIEDAEVLGAQLSDQLQNIHKNRFSDGDQYYVSQVPGVGNPVFDHELAYPGPQKLDAGLRILALLRLWNIIEYWFPYRDQLDDDWQSVLREFLPRFVEASTWDAYRLELLAFITRIQDTHANLWSELNLRPPRGNGYWPVEIRFIEGRATVTALVNDQRGHVVDLEIGDIIEMIDGQAVDSLIAAWSPYYCASNEARRLGDIAKFMPRGRRGECKLTINRNGQSQEVMVTRTGGAWRRSVPRDRSGETFQLLSSEVAYLKLSSIRVRDVADYIEQASDTRGLVIDIRNYPSEFVVLPLGARLVREPTPFVRFTVGDLNNPGAFIWTQPLELLPVTPGYTGKVTILVDEVSISSSEYTAMALRAGPQAVVVGNTTAGADGNVSPIPLPGGLSTKISGIGVFYPDKTPTQRVGIVPDIVVNPTIEGIREGRDEVLEAAIRHILGSDVDEEMIRRVAEGP